MQVNRLVSSATITAIAAAGWACSDAALTAVDPRTAVMCVENAGRFTLQNVSLSDLPAHKSRGDYIAELEVDPATTLVGDSIHYSRITDAVAAVRALRAKRKETVSASCAVTINVAAGAYRGTFSATSPDPKLESFPIRLDVPSIKLVGALAMKMDAQSRATGTGQTAAVTTLTPVAGMVTGASPQAVFVVQGHPDGTGGNDVTIEGFAIQSGHVGVDADSGGYGVFAMRAAKLTIRGNRFEPALTSAIDVRASDVTIANNYTGGGVVCDVCLAGPGTFSVTGNRITKGGIDGVVLSSMVILPVPAGIEAFDAPATARASATVANNDIRDHMRTPVGVAVRVSTIALGGSNAVQTTSLELRDNTLEHNTFGLLYEAGFPEANTTLKGDMNVMMANNRISGSCQADLMVTFTRHNTTLGAGQLTRPYIRNSNYSIDLGGDLSWSNVWYSHPAGLENTLKVDGALVPNGSRLAYAPTRVCP